jgi:hypothetical protein
MERELAKKEKDLRDEKDSRDKRTEGECQREESRSGFSG